MVNGFGVRIGRENVKQLFFEENPPKKRDLVCPLFSNSMDNDHLKKGLKKLVKSQNVNTKETTAEETIAEEATASEK